MSKRRVMLFESWNTTNAFDAILENVSGDIKDVQKDVDTIMKELKDEGKDAESDEVKAAILMQALDLADEGKDLEELDISRAKEEVKEGMLIRGKGYDDLNESASGLVHGLELVGNILGNAGLLEYISKQVEKATGKKPDMSKVTKTINGIAGALKKVTGLPAKAIAKFFEWIAGKFGMQGDMKKGLGLVGKLVVIVFLFSLGIAHFPVLGTGIIWWILSLTGLVGKSVEVAEIAKKIMKLIQNAGKNAEETKEETGLSAEELEGLVAA